MTTKERSAAEDPDRLLPDENPQSLSLDDARHWISVYGELVSFKEKLLRAADHGLQDKSLLRDPSVLRVTDLDALRTQHDRLKRRLRFWEDRRQALHRA